MILNYLKSKFKNIVVVDTEFTGEQNKGEFNKPICVVMYEINTDTTHRFSGSTLKLPYKDKETLYIAHNVIAEAHTFLSYGLKLPMYWYDTLIEDRKLYGNQVKSHSLLAACKRYNIPTISEDLKKYFVDELILKHEAYDQDTLNKIIGYCESDVKAGTQLFLNQLKDIEEKRNLEGPETIVTQALFSGAAVACTAKTEFNGIPVDNETLQLIEDNFPTVKAEMLQELNSELDLYDSNYIFKQEKFNKLIEKIGLAAVWPITATGKFKKDEKTLETFKDADPAIKKIRLAESFIGSQKLKGFIIGPDNRARCSYKMYGTSTGRTNPSTAKHAFNTPKCMRSLVSPDKDKVIVSFDYKSQEVVIAAHLSDDKGMKAAIQSGDPYIYVGQENKAIPPGATKKSHGAIREKYKVTALAALYGQGSESLSQRMNLKIDYGQELLVQIKKSWMGYFDFSKAMLRKAVVRGFAETKFGWRNYFKPGEDYNPRTYQNFPIQAHGSDMLRFALIQLTHKGFEVNGLIHDGIVLHMPKKNLRKNIIKAKKILIDASKQILNEDSSTQYFCDVELKVYRYRMIQGKDDQIKFNRILEIIKQHTQVKSPGVPSGKLPDPRVHINNNIYL